MLSKFKLNQLYFKDTQFANLMTRRIFNVLLIANPYDAFMLEDDGRIDEKIFNEYTSRFNSNKPSANSSISSSLWLSFKNSEMNKKNTANANNARTTTHTCIFSPH